MRSGPYDCILFDLLTALIDSPSLWNAVAGGEATGRRWRAEYLRRTYGEGRYRPYGDLVAEAAEAVGLEPSAASTLVERWDDLEPWPDTAGTLEALAQAGLRLGVVTNCSERLGRMAAERVGVGFATIVTAERAGWWKPDPQPYRLALEELGLDASRALFVAGSGYDLAGTGRVGLKAYWCDRTGLPPPPGAAEPIAREPTLAGLLRIAGPV